MTSTSDVPVRRPIQAKLRRGSLKHVKTEKPAMYTDTEETERLNGGKSIFGY